MAYNQNASQRNNNDEVYFDLMEHIGVLTNKENGWTKEVNIVAWNGGKPKVDIRDWDPDHLRMTKGITLFEEEAEKLTKALARRYGLRYTGTGPAKTFIRVEHTDQADHTGNADQKDHAGHTEEIPFKSASDSKAMSEGSYDADNTSKEAECPERGSAEDPAAAEDPASAMADVMTAVPPAPEAASMAAPA